MRLILPRLMFFAVSWSCVICSNYAIADGPGGSSYSDRDFTGGVIVRITDDFNLVVRDRKNGKERHFHKLTDYDPDTGTILFKTIVNVDGRAAKFDDIKAGMQVQIDFFDKVNGTKRDGSDIDPLPIISVRATSKSIGKN